MPGKYIPTKAVAPLHKTVEDAKGRHERVNALLQAKMAELAEHEAKRDALDDAAAEGDAAALSQFNIEYALAEDKKTEVAILQARADRAERVLEAAIIAAREGDRSDTAKRTEKKAKAQAEAAAAVTEALKAAHDGMLKMIDLGLAISASLPPGVRAPLGLLLGPAEVRKAIAFEIWRVSSSDGVPKKEFELPGGEHAGELLTGRARGCFPERELLEPLAVRCEQGGQLLVDLILRRR